MWYVAQKQNTLRLTRREAFISLKKRKAGDHYGVYFIHPKVSQRNYPVESETRHAFVASKAGTTPTLLDPGIGIRSVESCVGISSNWLK